MYDSNKCFKNQTTNWENHNEGISLQKEDLIQNDNASHQTKLAQVLTLFNVSALSNNPTTYTSSIILGTMFPSRKACSDDIINTIFGRKYGIYCKISDTNGLYKELPTMKI